MVENAECSKGKSKPKMRFLLTGEDDSDYIPWRKKKFSFSNKKKYERGDEKYL